MSLIDPGVFRNMVRVRRDLHEHPELSWKETRTAERIAAELERLGIPYRSGVGQTGIVADLPGPAGVPKVALRADMDALPIFEETGLPYASKVDGVMHACGHDGHVSMVVGAAELLIKRSDPLPAPVRLLFQPAEEQGAGARAMVKAGALEGVGMVFGGHLDRYYPAGVLVVTEGPVNAATDHFILEIHGKGGHGARPQEAVDAILMGGLFVTALQSIVSRVINPADAAVISVGTFQAGTAHNVIAGRARLEGTIRSQSPEVRDKLKAALRRVAEGTGALHSAAMELRIIDGTPAVINPADTAAIAAEAARQVEGCELAPLKSANMGGEDFSEFMTVVPGCYIRIGARPKSGEGHPAHSSRWDFDEDALGFGARYFESVALTAGRRLGGG